MNAWLAIVLAGLGSYAFRLGAILVVDRLTLPPWYERVSAYLMPAVFAGLAATAMAAPVADGGTSALALVAGGVTTIAVARTRSAATAMLVGMAVLCAVRLAAVALGST